MRVSLAVWNDSHRLKDKPYLEMNDLMVCNEDEGFLKQKYTLVACTHLTDNMINRIPEWLEYHRSVIGFEHFMIYIDSPNVDIYRKLLEKYLQRHPNLVTFVPFFFVSNRKAEYPGQGDCIIRLKGVSELASVFDVDEFFYLFNDSTTFVNLIKKYTDKDPALTGVYANSFFHGTLSGQYPDSTKLFMENFLLRMPTKARLLRDKGVVVVNRTNYLANHFPTSGELKKVVEIGKEFRVNHFRYPALPGELVPSRLVEDRSMRDKFSTKIKLELQKSGFAYL